MSNVLMNEIEIKCVYEYRESPTSSLDVAYNIGYELGASSAKDNRFDRVISHLVNKGILSKVYDVSENGSREGLYNFVGEKAQVSFYNNNLYYNY